MPGRCDPQGPDGGAASGDGGQGNSLWENVPSQGSLGAGGWFRVKTRLPKPGTYRLLADFDPTGGTPQMAARTFSGSALPPSLI